MENGDKNANEGIAKSQNGHQKNKSSIVAGSTFETSDGTKRREKKKVVS